MIEHNQLYVMISKTRCKLGIKFSHKFEDFKDMLDASMRTVHDNGDSELLVFRFRVLKGFDIEKVLIQELTSRFPNLTVKKCKEFFIIVYEQFSVIGGVFDQLSNLYESGMLFNSGIGTDAQTFADTESYGDISFHGCTQCMFPPGYNRDDLHFIDEEFCYMAYVNSSGVTNELVTDLTRIRSIFSRIGEMVRARGTLDAAFPDTVNYFKDIYRSEGLAQNVMMAKGSDRFIRNGVGVGGIGGVGGGGGGGGGGGFPPDR